MKQSFSSSAHQAFTSRVNVIAGRSGVLFFGAALLVLTQLRHVPPVGYVESQALSDNNNEDFNRNEA